MNETEILQILTKLGVVITDSHIVYTSGKHGNAYINKDAIYPHTKEISLLCKIIAERFLKSNVEVVVAPAIGGVILSQWIAHHLSQLSGKEVLGVYAEKAENNNDFVIKRGYDKLIKDKNILVVEDVLTTGGSVKKVIDLVKLIGGNIIGLGALCNRGGITSKDLGNIPEMFSLVNIKLDTWEEKDCPLCAKKVPINVDVGKGREYLAKKK